MNNDPSSPSNLLFLKLGGSLITDKAKPRTPRKDVITRLAGEICTARNETGDLSLLLGHGSGSFGHVPAKKYGTRQGVTSPAAWQGFAEVWYEASALNRILIEALRAASLPVVSFPISAGATTRDGQVAAWNLDPLCAALEADLLPVVYGDVAFDILRGGTILSTEDIFTHLARALKPQRILLAGIDEAVWLDYPECTQRIPEITPDNWTEVAKSLGGSRTTDVTGGMASKVRAMLDLTAEIPGLEVHIFSGNQPGNLFSVLKGESLGTRISQ
jgi:isopentenyl phosphate kinase